MQTESKVFKSDIIRPKNYLKNDLHNIFQIIPAVPIEIKSTDNVNSDCCFVPKNDKQYVPKKRITKKVRTVRDIRKTFESDIYTYLPADLERQKNLLLRKIRSGSARDENTKELAKTISNSPDPISKSAWQMIMNINPEEHPFPKQFVQWKNRTIQVNGCKGGKNKFILDYDILKISSNSKQFMRREKRTFPRKKSLLQHSMDVKFKPGPLSKKERLDDSYQKYRFGDMKLVTLPKPGLDIQPSYGKPLAPAINTFIQNRCLLNTEGVISQKWADFSVSVLGTLKNGNPVPCAEDCIVTFGLNYKCLQNRILMRHDSDLEKKVDISAVKSDEREDESKIVSEVYIVMNKMLDAVEISLNQNDMYSGVAEPMEVSDEKNVFSANYTPQTKNKAKRKLGELNRLDVTVITLADSSDTKSIMPCENAHCRLGCVCNSIKVPYIFKRHCGQVECMFKCKCDYSKYKLSDDNFDDDSSDIIPGLINFNKNLEKTLAKEEHKFHQTVIVTDEKSILLKSKRRNWKTSKKYADFFSNMQLKNIDRDKQEISVVCMNLNLKNVEPWCMVHNLYRCFCKGRFTELTSPGIFDGSNLVNVPDVVQKKEQIIEHIDLSNVTTLNTTKTSVNIPEPQVSRNSNENYSCDDEVSTLLAQNINDIDNKCARTSCYTGRKYSERYYYITNRKIFNMEKNDQKLHKKMISLMLNCDTFNLDEETSQNIVGSQVVEGSPKEDATQKHQIHPPPSLDDLLSSVINQNIKSPIEDLTVQSDKNAQINIKRMPDKESLVSWLESNYKFFRDKTLVNPNRTGLTPPKYGKIALYPWNFILSRYRDRKNLFMITKEKPFRIFMAVNKRNPYFNNCIDISDIALSDINKYPETIKNLLTNATETSDNFYILYGLSFCWEIIGSVTKVNENIREKVSALTENHKRLTMSAAGSNITSTLEPDCFIEPLEHCTENKSYRIGVSSTEPEINSKQSKWFLMTIVKDFSEIQFFKRGFFVKYENLINATTVAKRLGKTVRLSSQQCNSNDLQFGIYAIPSSRDNYVFIGPYDKDDVLGIETVKTESDLRKGQCTRGTWITTNKVDNFKVIDNPLLYIPSSKVNEDKMITLQSNCSTSRAGTSQAELIDGTSDYKSELIVKIAKNNLPHNTLKPIKIRRSNNFRLNILPQNNLITNKSLLINNTEIKKLQICRTVVVEKNIIHGISGEKVSIVESPGVSQQKKFEGGMFVLKPEEINKRSLENTLFGVSSTQSEQNFNVANMDIENFLSENDICVPSEDDIFVISDDEEDYSKESTDTTKEVWIVCKNIPNLGWIPGRKNLTNKLSFEFPGFSYTDFYSEQEVFKKINQVLARKVYVAKQTDIEWSVVESATEVDFSNKLQSTKLTTDYVLTKKGLFTKQDLIGRLKRGNKSYSPTKVETEQRITHIDAPTKDIVMDQVNKTGQILEEKACLFEVAEKDEIIESSKTDDEHKWHDMQS